VLVSGFESLQNPCTPLFRLFGPVGAVTVCASIAGAGLSPWRAYCRWPTCVSRWCHAAPWPGVGWLGWPRPGSCYAMRWAESRSWLPSLGLRGTTSPFRFTYQVVPWLYATATMLSHRPVTAAMGSLAASPCPH
jgi:hypothetical protein